MKEKFCTGCGRNCNLDNPKCGKGVELAEEDDTFNGHSGDWLRARKERYKSFDTNNKLICNIRDMGHTVRAMSDGKASQSRILIVLNTEGAITQSKLTELLNVQPGTVSEVIGKLERAGLIERTASENDRRTSELRLTVDGVEMAMQASEARKNRYEDMFACLTESEKFDLLALLEKVNEDWERRYDYRRANRNGRHHHEKRDYHGHRGHHSEG